jgi:hypothetical protein
VFVCFIPALSGEKDLTETVPSFTALSRHRNGSQCAVTCLAVSFSSGQDVRTHARAVGALVGALAGCAGRQLHTLLLFEPTDALDGGAGSVIADALELELARWRGDVPDEVVLGWGQNCRRTLLPRRHGKHQRPASPPWTLHVWLLGATDALAQPLAMAQLGSGCESGDVKVDGRNGRAAQGGTPASLSERVAGAQQLLDTCSLCPPAPQAVLCVGDAAMGGIDSGPCLAGFPPWLASCAEVYPLPALGSLRPRHVEDAWRRLGDAVLRHGA